jgi:cytochrome c oxidase subunit 4
VGVLVSGPLPLGEGVKSSNRDFFRVYLALMLLLALTAAAPFFASPLYANAISFTVAVAKAVLILYFFMRLRETPPRIRVFAVGATLWVVFLFALTFGDYLTRGLTGVPGK